MTLLLTRGDLERLLILDRVQDAVEASFGAYTAGRAQVPARVGVGPSSGAGVMLVMPCALMEPACMGTKIVSVFSGNAARGLPTVSSLYVLSDSETGSALAVMDGGFLTGIRTAAGSAVAARYLARADAEVLGVIGTGVQAAFHVRALAAVRPLRQVLVAGTDREKAERFCGWIMQQTGLNALACTTATASQADIVAACTTSPTPVVEDRSVRPGAYVCSVGSFRPTERELPSALISRALVFVDMREAAFAEAGDLLLPVAEGAFSLDRVAGELGQLVLGDVPGRTDRSQITVYKSVGAAFLDAATAHLAYDRALAEGVGTAFGFD